MKKILDLEKKLNDKQKLEMEIEDFRGQLEVMKHMGNDNDHAIQKKIQLMTENLNEKIEELKHSEDLSQTLLVRERQSNDELHAARKLFITVCLCYNIVLLICFRSYSRFYIVKI